MIFVNTKDELDENVKIFNKRNEVVSIVPTMGNLHDGHLSLIEIAKNNSTKVIISIFINPLQFGKNEDFDNYPRSINKDIEKLKNQGMCDLLFLPSDNKEVFGNIENLKFMKSGKLGNILCGKHRPGHFDGVLTVVNQLFTLIKPKIAVFGKKDYQQQVLIKKMVKNKFPLMKILTGPIIRDKQGLALSSRNSYLTNDEKKLASSFFKTLIYGTHIFKKSKSFANVINEVKNMLLKFNFEVEYIEIRNSNLDKILKEETNQKKILLGSIKIGNTKLIDNVEFY